MWAKISSALKRPETPAQDFNDDHDGNVKPPSVLNAVFNQHPNLSNFHEPSEEVLFPTPSPPASPSKHGRRGIFKRTPKAFPDNDQGPQLPIKLSIPHLKKVKSSIQPNSASSDASSISRASIESSKPRQSEDSLRSPEVARAGPNTPITDKFNSLRSILRDGNTPATGQSVRFFSRDAYKTISPDVSAASGASSSEPEPASFASRIKGSSSTPARPPLQDVFSPPQSSMLETLPQANSSNPFDLSQDMDVPPIPVSKDTPLLDTAIELPSDADTDGTILRPEIEGEFRSSTPSGRPPSGMHDRSQSFSFGQTVFHSIGSGGRDSPVSPANSSGSFSRGSFKLKSRSRAYSDTVFHSFAPSVPPKEPSVPEADIDDRSNSAIVLYPAQGSPAKEKDPFGANANAYYTPGTGVPPTPPSSAPAHGRKASREEDLILSLRTQLALQTELCAQYEVDLGARDEITRMLQSRLDETEKECERRKNVIRSWRKRVSELERCIHALQDEVERSREESMERSVMDEASGQALRSLHRRIEELEREKLASEKREQRTAEELSATKVALAAAQEELGRRDESERELKDGIARAKEQIELMDMSMESEAAGDRSRAFSIAAWEEERKALTATNESLRTDFLNAQTQLADAREEALRANNELEVIKAELEAQWRGTEQQTERIAELEKERDELHGQVETLNARIGEMEAEWTQAENRKNEVEAEMQELWTQKEELETQRTELQIQVRAEQEHSEELTRALREREDKVIALEHEQKFSQERVSRLEARLREREAELSEISKKQTEREADAENAQDEIAKMKREHARIVNEQSRTLQDVVAREVEARASMETMVREKAETDVQLASLKERSEALTAEVERLRRQVHDLQQESADKEMKVVQLEKRCARDKEDLEGLNIALDSKQQELEMLKRRLNIRGTAGSTPASTAKVQPSSRRESSIFGTPAVGGSRPPSALSDTGSVIKERRISEAPSTATKSTLGKSVRVNNTASTSASTTGAVKKRSLEGSMGPPPARAGSASATATPTRIPSGSSARTPSTIKVPIHQRRTSTSILEPSKLRTSTSSREKLEKLTSVSSASEPDEKENSAPSSRASTTSVSSASSNGSATKATRRVSAVPA
ncbi:hypothetical protein BN946_scf184926.g2 [Trametes cinnabarina]|uniref:Myosin tail domain-containing protein n=1 Tax=Pycnoporus cinnabarinus TaxID=5643 RepID=A0A060ST43_PYCCI|nr:hypothetical protein BN946_scf184926.g2 [Trametes cinnabarina]